MFVSPLEHETCFPVARREVVVVDSNNYTVFLRFLDELAERHREQLLYGKRHATFVKATSMKVDQASRSLLTMAASTINFQQSLRHNDLLEGVREQIENDSSIRQAVKNVILLRRDAQKPTNKQDTDELPVQVRSVKYMFNYIF